LLLPDAPDKGLFCGVHRGVAPLRRIHATMDLYDLQRQPALDFPWQGPQSRLSSGEPTAS